SRQPIRLGDVEEEPWYGCESVCFFEFVDRLAVIAELVGRITRLEMFLGLRAIGGALRMDARRQGEENDEPDPDERAHLPRSQLNEAIETDRPYSRCSPSRHRARAHRGATVRPLSPGPLGPPA